MGIHRTKISFDSARLGGQHVLGKGCWTSHEVKRKFFFLLKYMPSCMISNDWIIGIAYWTRGGHTKVEEGTCPSHQS